MELPEQAARALAVVQKDGRELRYVIEHMCDSPKHRLSVRYRNAAGEELRLGLLWSEDRAALDALRERLATS
jgi:D-serine deaminase-like pyridoxal phosphate-dependent protein